MHPDILISDTGVIQGRGTAPWKYVSHLTNEERIAVRSGKWVFIRDFEAHHYTQSGWKIVIVYSNGSRFCHREPSPDQLKALNTFLNRRAPKGAARAG